MKRIQPENEKSQQQHNNPFFLDKNHTKNATSHVCMSGTKVLVFVYFSMDESVCVSGSNKH